MVIDTPGLLEGSDSDISHIGGMVYRLHQLGYINSIFIVYNGTD